MKLINITKDTVVAEDVVVVDSFLGRIKGLLGRKSLKQGKALIIRPCNSVHTFFMRFPIDVLFVTKDNKVVKAISHLQPFRLSPVYFSSSFVVELPSGSIHYSKTSVSDTLSFR